MVQSGKSGSPLKPEVEQCGSKWKKWFYTPEKWSKVGQSGTSGSPTPRTSGAEWAKLEKVVLHSGAKWFKVGQRGSQQVAGVQVGVLHTRLLVCVFRLKYNPSIINKERAYNFSFSTRISALRELRVLRAM